MNWRNWALGLAGAAAVLFGVAQAETEVSTAPQELGPGPMVAVPGSSGDIDDAALQEAAEQHAASLQDYAAADFASSLTQRAVRLMQDESLASEERRLKFRALVEEAFDVERLSLILLGRNRTQLDDRQMQDYQAVVPDYLVALYAARIDKACEGAPEILEVRRRSGTVFVRTAFVKDETQPPVYVDWVVLPQKDGSWRAIDISINGVSLAKSKYEEFDTVIQGRGPDAFLELLYEQAGLKLPQLKTAPVAPVLPDQS